MQGAGNMTDAIAGDVLTEARRKRKDVEMLPGERGGIEFRATQVPIDYYQKRGILNITEYRAANKLFRDFVVSGQTRGTVIDLNPVRSGLNSFSEAQLEARERWRHALMAVSGTIAKMMVINVCCYGEWLKDTRYLHYKTSQDAMARFHEALDDLISHYDLTRNSR